MRDGGTFQEWSECFDVNRWTDAMAAEGLSLDWYVFRHRDEDEILPWEHLSAGLHKDFLWLDWKAALAESGVEDCRWTPCYDCGVCTGYGLEHVVASPVPPAVAARARARTWHAVARSPSSCASVAATRRRRTGGGRVKLVVRYTKLGKVRFTSHRDAARLWERALRKAELPVAMSQGFTPRPRISFGLALPTGARAGASTW